eukprot:GSMAST32.ASY1.ANO1.1612.1 assembled CDS
MILFSFFLKLCQLHLNRCFFFFKTFFRLTFIFFENIFTKYMMPSLNVEKLATTKCLLFGAGTLGCYVSRALIVSYSNPVRQPLFNFVDCEGGGLPKAQAAADSLKKVFPGVESRGICMSIPMPGHPVSIGSIEEEHVSTIEKLVSEHDVLFLLTDTRESRWLPSLLGRAMGKLVLNAALGFDTYMVMRHGYSEETKESGSCYFCNDVVAPLDSMSNRALDQQCTVTRPGLAAIASASAVELMVNILHHPLGSTLGLVPHQIRGFLSHFSQVLPVARSFDQCIACSPKIISNYRENGADLVIAACNTPKLLEKITGLEELQRKAEEALISMDAWDDSDDDEAAF